MKKNKKRCIDNSAYIDESPEVREITVIQEISDSFVARAEFEKETSESCRIIDAIIARHLENIVFGDIIR
jgi:hypothetical protein